MTERPCPHRDDHACSVCEDLASFKGGEGLLRNVTGAANQLRRVPGCSAVTFNVRVDGYHVDLRVTRHMEVSSTDEVPAGEQMALWQAPQAATGPPETPGGGTAHLVTGAATGEVLGCPWSDGCAGRGCRNLRDGTGERCDV
jgi:hypothetical protein